MMKSSNFLWVLPLLLSISPTLSLDYEESISEMLIQCNSYQTNMFFDNRTTRPCENDNFGRDYSFIIEPMATKYSKQEFLCFLFKKDKGFKLKFKLWLSHRHFSVDAYGVKFKKPEGDKWESRIKFETTVFVVVPLKDRPVPQIFGFELNGVEKCPLCGKRLENPSLHSRIHDGDDTDAIRWPWHATIYHIQTASFKYKCGGTLIQSKAVVTTAFCLMDKNRKIQENALRVSFGENELMSDNASRLQVFRTILHKNFDPETMENNIGLMVLANQLKLSADVLPICLPNFGTIMNGIGIAVGYGKSEKLEKLRTLQQVDIPDADDDECYKEDNDFYEKYRNDKNFCAGWNDKLKNVCGEDTGGGLYIEKNGIFYLKGLTSVTRKTSSGTCNKFALFTDVSLFTKWIESEMSSF